MKIDQDKLRKKRRRWVFTRISGTFSLAVLLFCGISLLSFAEFWQIKKISVVGTDFENPASIEAEIGSTLAKNIFYFFSGRNSLFFSRDAVKSNLSNIFHSIENIDIDFKGFNSITINIKERKVVAIWCGEKCFYLDENGLAFFETPVLENPEVIVFDGGDGDRILGFQFVDTARYKKIMFFVFELGKTILKPIKVSLIGEREMHVFFEAGGYLKVDPRSDLSIIARKINDVVLNSKSGLGEKEFMEKLDYIDIRSGNKIVYNFKNE